jgi:hypothetical protein
VDRLVLVATLPGGPRSRPMPLATTYLLVAAPFLTSKARKQRFVDNTLGPAIRRRRPKVADRLAAAKLAHPQSEPRSGGEQPTLRWSRRCLATSSSPTHRFTATRAITVAAPPEDVWPWILQLGTGRAGWYSYDLFDNAARPSADRILPQFQAIRTGDWVPMSATVNETTAFKVTAFAANRWLLWAKPDSTWAWQLTPIDGGHTRLVIRLKERYPWRASPGLALLTMVMPPTRCCWKRWSTPSLRSRACAASRAGRASGPPSSTWTRGYDYPRYRRLQGRYERRADILLAFLHLACALICRKSLMRPTGMTTLQRP